jgi:uncharacterized membrane protein
MAIVLFVMWGALSLTYGNVGVETEEYMIGINMPKSLRNEPEVKAIMATYYKQKHLVSLIAFLVGALTLLLYMTTGIFIIVMMAWFFAFMVFMDFRLRHFAKQLIELKKDKDWLYDINDDEQWLKNGKSINKSKVHAKRIGIGTECNISRKAEYIIMGVVFVSIAVLGIFLMNFDFGHTNFYAKGHELHFEAPMYSDTVAPSEIEEVKWLNDCPSMNKSNGYNGGKMNVGTFRVDGFGTCRVYYNLKIRPVIVVKTAEKTIIYNSEDEKQMEKDYLLIRNKMERED